MIHLGLTGNIASGKSTVTRMLKHFSIPVFDADKAIHNAMETNKSLKNELQKTFPKAWDKNQINRKILGDLVFDAPEQLAKLETLLHPHVWKAEKAFKKQMQKAKEPIIVSDIPLLFESGAENDMTKSFSSSSHPYSKKFVPCNALV